MADIEKAEREKMADKCKRIIGHGINCFVNRQLIYNFPEQIFADNGVMAIEHADFDGIERLALVTGKSPPIQPHGDSFSMPTQRYRCLAFPVSELHCRPDLMASKCLPLRSG